MIIIVEGNRKEYEDYCRSHSLDPRKDALDGNGPLVGYHVTEVRLVGSWARNKYNFTEEFWGHLATRMIPT